MTQKPNLIIVVEAIWQAMFLLRCVQDATVLATREHDHIFLKTMHCARDLQIIH